MKPLKLALISVALLFSTSPQIFAQPADVQVRVEGLGVSIPDTINGLQAMVTVSSNVKLTWSVQSAVKQPAGTLVFEIYSPSNPGMYVGWLSSGGTYGSSIVALNSWASPSVWSLAGTIVATDIDGVLPEQFLIGGASMLNGGFQSDSLLDVFMTELVFVDTGVVCIDSAFFPPSGDWLMTATGPPTWGGTPSGYPDGGFCITVTQPGCCATPGDANGDASVNISDLTYIIARIFSGGPAPVCENEGDANGDKSLNIADAAFLVSRIFGGGPAPHCWWQSDPNEAVNYTFFGIPDTLVVSPCGSFNDTLPFFVSRGAGSTIFDLPAEFSIVDESSGIIASLLAPFSDTLVISGMVNSGQDEFVVIRATSSPFGSGIQTDKIILITCQ